MHNTFIGFTAVFGAMFAIANPFSGIPFFLGYAAPLKSWQQKLLGAFICTLAVWLGCLVVLFGGDAALNFFGISIPGLRVGGGFVILISGLAMMKMRFSDTTKAGRSLWSVIGDLVRKGHSPQSAATSVAGSSGQASDSLLANAQHPDAAAAAAHVARADAAAPGSTLQAAVPDTEEGSTPVHGHFHLHLRSSSPGTAEDAKNRKAALLTLMFPFAVPMILGPGFISTILISHKSNSDSTVIIAFTILAVIQIIAFALGTPINRLIGTFGMNTLVRIVGLIIVILAFEIMAAGLVDLLPGLAAAK